MINDADGAFVPMKEALLAARAIAVGRNVRADYSDNEGSADFRRWVLHNLSPAVQDFKHHHGNQTVGVFFYKFATSTATADQMKASYQAVCDELDGRSLRRKVCVPIQFLCYHIICSEPKKKYFLSGRQTRFGGLH